LDNGATTRLMEFQHDVLVALARGLPLTPALETFCRRIEAMMPGLVCSVLSVDRDGCLHTVAAPSLPPYYCKAIDGHPIGPKVGSCGTAAFRGEAVEVTDIATDPLWADFTALALPLGLRACWSSPIRSSDGRVIGTFAFYFRTARGARDDERLIVADCVHLCAIALEQEESKRRIERLAHYDALTGLLNRATFLQKTGEALAASVERGERLAIYCLDLDGFKSVNDTCGHLVGDRLLANVAQRFSARLGACAEIARLGGDEFAVLQTSIVDIDDCHAVAECLIGAVREPFEIDGRKISVGVSVGVAQAPLDGSSLQTVMKKADIALYHAKKVGRGRCCVFDSELADRLATRQAMERDLAQAATLGQFALSLRPIVDLRRIEIGAFRVSLIWRHPQRGALEEAEFLPLAEELGLGSDIGAWFLDAACRLGAQFPDSARLIVPATPARLREPGFALKLATTLARRQLPVERVELELAETAILADDEAIGARMNDLKTLGVAVSIGHFGMKYAALARLRLWPFDRIEIDRKLVAELGMDDKASSILRAIATAARDLDIKVGAAGVQTPVQLRTLRALGVDEFRGALAGADIASEQLERFCRRRDDAHRIANRSQAG
jgi:diguanylate cyclase (GGDEF)-like protein